MIKPRILAVLPRPTSRHFGLEFQLSVKFLLLGHRDQLRGMRQPCRKVRCKNPAHEDGYCDNHRPFDADKVPFREDWLDGEGLLKTNNPKCPYYGSTSKGKSYRSKAAADLIEEIRSFLND